MVRKIISGTLIGLSSILLVLSLAGIALVWIYNEPLTRQAVARLQAVDLELTQAQTALQDARLELERTLRIVEAAEKTLASLKAELAQAKALFGDVNGALDESLLPVLQASRDQLTQAKSALQAARDTLEGLNSLPFVDLDLPGDQMLADLIATANSLDSQIVQVENLTQQASTFLEDASYLMGGDLTETKQSLQDFVVVVNTYEDKVSGWHTQVTGWLAVLPGWIDRASIILTVFLAWFGFSQFGLLLHGLTAWGGGDPLADLRKALKKWRRKIQRRRRAVE